MVLDDSFTFLKQCQDSVLNHADKLLAVGSIESSLPPSSYTSSSSSLTAKPTTSKVNPASPVSVKVVNVSYRDNPIPTLYDNIFSAADDNNLLLHPRNISTTQVSPMEMVIDQTGDNINVPVASSSSSISPLSLSSSNQNIDNVYMTSFSGGCSGDYSGYSGGSGGSGGCSGGSGDYSGGCSGGGTQNDEVLITQNDVDKMFDSFGSPSSSVHFDDNYSIDSMDNPFLSNLLKSIKDETIQQQQQQQQFPSLHDGLVELVYSLLSLNYPLTKNKVIVDTLEIPQMNENVKLLRFAANREEVTSAVQNANFDAAIQLKENLYKYRFTLMEQYFKSQEERITFIENFCGSQSTNQATNQSTTKMTTIIEKIIEPCLQSSTMIADENLIGCKCNTDEPMTPMMMESNAKTAESISGAQQNSTTTTTPTVYTMPNPYVEIKATTKSTSTPNILSEPSIDILESIVASVAIENENWRPSSSSVFDTPPMEYDGDDRYKFRMQDDVQKDDNALSISSLSLKRKLAFKREQQTQKKRKKENKAQNDEPSGGGGGVGGEKKSKEAIIKKGTHHLESIRSELDVIDDDDDEVFTDDDEDNDQFEGLIDDEADRKITYLLDKNNFDTSLIFKDNREPGTHYERIYPKYQEFKPIKIKPRPSNKKTVKALKLIFDESLNKFEWEKDSPIKYPFSVDQKKIYTLNTVSENHPTTSFWINRITELFRHKIQYTDFKHFSTNTSDDLVTFRLALGYVPLQYKSFCLEMYKMKEKSVKNTTDPKSYEPLFYLGELEMLTYCYWELSTQDVIHMDLTPSKKKNIKILLHQAVKDFKNLPIRDDDDDEKKQQFDSFYYKLKTSCLFNNPELTYIDMLAIKEKFTEIHGFINESKLTFDEKKEQLWIWYNIFHLSNCHHYLVPHTKVKCWIMLNQFVTHLEYFSQIPSNKFSLDGLKELSKTFIENVYGDKFEDKNARSTVGSRILYFIDRFAYSFCAFSSLSVGLQSNQLNETNVITIMANLAQMNKKKGYTGNPNLQVTISRPLVLLFSKLIRFYFYHFILNFAANGVSQFKVLNYKLTTNLAAALQFALSESLKALTKKLLDENEFGDAIKGIPFIGDIEKDSTKPSVFSETFKESLYNYNLATLFKIKSKKNQQPPLDANMVASNTRKRKKTAALIPLSTSTSTKKTTTKNNNGKKEDSSDDDTDTDDDDDADDDDYGGDGDGDGDGDTDEEDGNKVECKIFKKYNAPDFRRGQEIPTDKGDNLCHLCSCHRSPRSFRFYQNGDIDGKSVLMTVCSFCIERLSANTYEQMKKVHIDIFDRVSALKYKSPLLFAVDKTNEKVYTTISVPEERKITKATRSYELNLEVLKKKGYTRFG